MAQLSVLEYARYFDLTKPYTDNDINDQISMFCSAHQRPQQRTLDRNISDLDATLLETFERAAQQYASPSDDELPSSANNTTDHFQFCEPLSDAMRFQILQTLAQPFRFKRNLKMPLPLLKIGGGNVERDVRKIKRGINLDRALQEIVEDYESNHMLTDTEIALEANVQDQVLNLIQEHTDRRSMFEPCEITVTHLRFLKEAVTNPLEGQQVSHAVMDTLPIRSNRPQPQHRDIAKEDYDLHAQDEVSCGSFNPVAFNLDQKADFIKRDSKPLSFLASSLDTRNVVHDPLEASAPNLNALDFWEEFTNIDDLDDPTSCGESSQLLSRYICPQDSPHVTAQYSAGAAEAMTLAINDQNDQVNTPISRRNSSPTRPGVNGSTKISLPDLNANSFEPPALDIDYLLTFTPGVNDTYNGKSFDLGSFRANLPFKIPDLRDTISGPKPFTSVSLERYLARPSNITSSSDMLYKDPRTRVLDKTSDDEEELKLEVYPLEEQTGNMTKSAVAEKPNGPTSTSVLVTTTDVQESLIATRRFSLSNKLNTSTSSNTISTPNDEQSRQHSYNLQAISSDSLKPSALIHSMPKTSNLDRSVLGKRKRGLIHEAANYDKPPDTHCLPETVLQVDRSSISTGIVGHHESQSDSLFSFLGLRGKQFHKPPTTSICKAAELYDDPIQCTQSEQHMTGSKIDNSGVPHNIEPALPNLLVPQWSSLGQFRTIVVNNSLLQRKPILIRYLEQTESDMLCLLYRDLDAQRLGGADIILNASTCVLITSTQALDQRSLPGQTSNTGLSKTHDSVVTLTHAYSHVIVLVHYLHPTDSSSDSKITSTLTEFLSFCQKCAITHGQIQCKVSPVWLPCGSAASTADVVNAWVWQLIRNYGHRKDAKQQLGSGILLQEETLWELFLRAIGINPLAAQLMLGLLKKTNEGVQSGGENDTPWGIRRLISMGPTHRSSLFGKILSKATLDDMTALLQRGIHSFDLSKDTLL